MVRILIGLLLLGLPESILAAAWMLPKGSAVLIFNTNWYYTNRFWDSEGNLSPLPAFNELSLNPYFEYGLTNDLTVGQSSYFRQAWWQDVNTGLKGGDSAFFGRYRLWC